MIDNYGRLVLVYLGLLVAYLVECRFRDCAMSFPVGSFSAYHIFPIYVYGFVLDIPTHSMVRQIDGTTSRHSTGTHSINIFSERMPIASYDL